MREEKKRIYVDYYKVEVSEGGRFHNILRRIGGLTNGEERNFNIRGAFPLRLSHIEERPADGRLPDVFIGEMTKIRMTGLPVKASIAGKSEEIDFMDDEGVGEETGFLFEPASGCLLLQRNRSGITTTAFEAYFSATSGTESVVELSPMIGTRALEKLLASSRLSRLEIKLAPAIIGGDLKDERGSVGCMLSAMDELEGCTVELTVGLGRKRTRNSLAVKKVTSTVKHLLKRNSDLGDVAKLKAMAEYDELVGLSPIDFIQDRLCHFEDIPYDQSRRLLREDIEGLLRRAWTNEEFQMALQNAEDAKG